MWDYLFCYDCCLVKCFHTEITQPFTLGPVYNYCTLFMQSIFTSYRDRRHSLLNINRDIRYWHLSQTELMIRKWNCVLRCHGLSSHRIHLFVCMFSSGATCK